jgi:hypothetical protein
LEDFNFTFEGIYSWLQVFDALPLWGIGLLFFGVMLIALEFGFRTGKSRRDTWRDAETGGGGIVQTSIFAILGLVLAFTYSAGLSRFEARKAALLNEANAIGTAFQRADLVTEPGRTELRKSLFEYATTRSIPPRSILSVQEFNDLLSRTLEKQARIWPAAKQVMAQDNPAPLKISVVASINSVHDAHTIRMAAVFDRLHPTVVWLLVLAAASAMTVAGYNAGIQGRVSRLRMSAFSIVLASLAIVILDLDRPNDGTIIVDQRIMNILIADMQKTLNE